MTGDSVSNRYARLAGFMFLFGIASYMCGQFLADGIAVPNNFALTAHNVAASNQTYRIGLTLMLVTSWGTVLLAASLYALLKPVAPTLALFALLWRVAEATLGGGVSILRFARMHSFLGADARIGELLASLISAASYDANNIAELFFATGSLLFFWVLFRSRFIPRVLSLFGVGASFAIGLLGGAHLALPQPIPALEYAWAPIFISEIATGLWLLLAGVNTTLWNGRD